QLAQQPPGSDRHPPLLIPRRPHILAPGLVQDERYPKLMGATLLLLTPTHGLAEHNVEPIP
ncbi:MAG: hypothetical protein K2I48_05440, partial [Muribaculaceae bacterium]|nr:hypothetical protein [Muribaculaceae bacterium]